MAANGYDLTLGERLAKSLPEGCRFTIHHLSTPPTICLAIYAAPPNEDPEETYCESHFLSVSIDSNGSQLQIFAIEVLIFTTEYLTTLFVSKADSTGYLHLLKLPQGTPSPLKIISTTFLHYLIKDRERSDRRLVLSLFARAQNQYLFPGSIENGYKHVLDDRGLIKWWCKVVDPILGTYENDTNALEDRRKSITRDQLDSRSHGFLRVPGCDTYETQNFLPRDLRGRIAEKNRWLTRDPLCELGRSPGLPERCLIPRFPDDPKARFVETLDDEIPVEVSQPPLSITPASPSKKQNDGRWRSVKSLEQFWEMMQFRQECSSGRLVGFLWATFQPATLCGEKMSFDDEERPQKHSQSSLPTPVDSQHEESCLLPPQSPLRSSPAPGLPPLTPQKPIRVGQTPTPTPVKRKQAAATRDLPEKTKYYYWPKSSRGELILRQRDYQLAGSLLLRLDYANEIAATDSARKWIRDVAERAGLKSWGRHVVGRKTTPPERDPVTDAKPVMLNSGLIRKKKRPAEDGGAVGAGSEGKEPGINTLSAGLVRKKAKIASHVGPAPMEDPRSNVADEC